MIRLLKRPPPPDVNPACSGLRTFLVPPDIVPAKRTSPQPPRVKKRTPWHPAPDGQQTTVRPGREWFGDAVFVELQDGHSRSSYTVSAVVHACAIAAVIVLFIARPDQLIFVDTHPVLAMPATVAPPPVPVAEIPAPRPSQRSTQPSAPIPAPIAPPPPPPAGDVTAAPAPVEAPTGIAPEIGAEARTAGVDGGVAGGISGGVVGGTGTVAAGPGPTGPLVVRVGGAIKPPRKIKDFKPEYPLAALPLKAHGTVLVEATIGVDGRVQDAKVLVSIPALDQAALDAVRRWEYEPSILNGVAVAVIMKVMVNFALQ